MTPKILHRPTSIYNTPYCGSTSGISSTTRYRFSRCNASNTPVNRLLASATELCRSILSENGSEILSPDTIYRWGFGSQNPTSKDPAQLIPQTGSRLPKQRLVPMTQRQSDQPIRADTERSPFGQLHTGHRLIVAPTHLLQHRMSGCEV